MRRPAWRPARQRGIAALELALVIGVLLLVFWGLATFLSVLYTQQAISRAAENGARALSVMWARQQVSDAAGVQAVVQSAVLGALPDTLAGHADVTVTASETTWQVAVAYPYAANPLLPAIALPGAGGMGWLPQQLSATATVTP